MPNPPNTVLDDTCSEITVETPPNTQYDTVAGMRDLAQRMPLGQMNLFTQYGMRLLISTFFTESAAGFRSGQQAYIDYCKNHFSDSSSGELFGATRLFLKLACDRRFDWNAIVPKGDFKGKSILNTVLMANFTKEFEFAEAFKALMNRSEIDWDRRDRDIRSDSNKTALYRLIYIGAHHNKTSLNNIGQFYEKQSVDWNAGVSGDDSVEGSTAFAVLMRLASKWFMPALRLLPQLIQDDSLDWNIPVISNQPHHGNTPLFYYAKAAFNGYKAALAVLPQMLASKRVNWNACNMPTYHSALYYIVYAIVRNHKKFSSELLIPLIRDSAINWNVRIVERDSQEHGKTPIHLLLELATSSEPEMRNWVKPLLPHIVKRGNLNWHIVSYKRMRASRNGVEYGPKVRIPFSPLLLLIVAVTKDLSLMTFLNELTLYHYQQGRPFFEHCEKRFKAMSDLGIGDAGRFVVAYSCILMLHKLKNNHHQLTLSRFCSTHPVLPALYSLMNEVLGSIIASHNESLHLKVFDFGDLTRNHLVINRLASELPKESPDFNKILEMCLGFFESLTPLPKAHNPSHNSLERQEIKTANQIRRGLLLVQTLLSRRCIPETTEEIPGSMAYQNALLYMHSKYSDISQLPVDEVLVRKIRDDTVSNNQLKLHLDMCRAERKLQKRQLG